MIGSTHDVIIVGGGPGGLYAARLLADNGFDVVIIEEHACVGKPVHCTGVVAAEAYREFDIPREAILNELQTVRFYSPRGQSFSYTTEAVEAVVVDRVVFDETMWRRAAGAGAAIVTGQRATGLALDDDGVQVSLADHTLHARACILACGADYKLQLALGFGMPSLFLQSAQIELPAQASNDVEIHFGSQVAPKGFAWAVPVRRGNEDSVRVGLMCHSDAGGYFDRFFHSISSRWGIAPDLLVEPRRKILPLAPISKTFTDRILVVGDAAGIVKPTTGGGIYYSIAGGAIAAKVLSASLRTNRLGAAALEQYETRWKRYFGGELEAQLRFRAHVERLSDEDMEDLFELARVDGIIPLMRKTASFNRHRGLILALLQHREFRSILFRAVSA